MHLGNRCYALNVKKLVPNLPSWECTFSRNSSFEPGEDHYNVKPAISTAPKHCKAALRRQPEGWTTNDRTFLYAQTLGTHCRLRFKGWSA